MILSLFLFGIAVGIFGTMIGAGGGFLMVPVLLFMYPTYKPEVITAISLAVVALNAMSGTVTYALQKKIDYRAGILFAVASLPGAFIGVHFSEHVDRKTFEPIFGFVLLAIALFLFFKKPKSASTHNAPADSTAAHDYSKTTGIIISIFVGFISSFLGIGGGIIHVPALIHVLNFPVFSATATSHFILAIVAVAGTIEHYARGNIMPGLTQILSLGPGVILGAPIGAWASRTVKPALITKALAVALLIVSGRLIVLNLF